MSKGNSSRNLTRQTHISGEATAGESSHRSRGKVSRFLGKVKENVNLRVSRSNDSRNRNPVPPNVDHEHASSTPNIEVQDAPSGVEVEADTQLALGVLSCAAKIILAQADRDTAILKLLEKLYEVYLRIQAGKHQNPAVPKITDLPDNFRFIVTSRPLGDINDEFHGVRHIRQMSMGDILPAVAERDIRAYVSKELEGLGFHDREFAVLDEKAGGLFEWARLAYGYIKEPHAGLSRMDCYDTVVARDPAERSMLLHSMYDLIVTNIMPRDTSTHVQHSQKSRSTALARFRSVMGQIIGTDEPIPCCSTTHERLVFCLELLALINALNGAVPALSLVPQWLKSHSEFKDISSTAMDIQRFIQVSGGMILHSTPHLYLSALPFSPVNSPLSSPFCARFPNTLRVAFGRDMNWPAVQTVLREHTESVDSVSFSPDGTRIVTGSSDKTVRLWDAATGQPVGEPLRGHTSRVDSVSSSLDGTLVVTSFSDEIVRLCDVVMRQPSQQRTESDHSSFSNEPRTIKAATTIPLNTRKNHFISFSFNSIYAPCNTSELTEGASHDDRSSTPFVLNIDSGWVVAPKRRLLFWVSPASRHSFWSPGTALMMSRGPELDLSRMAHGQHWQKC